MTVELSRSFHIIYNRANIGPPDRARAYHWSFIGSGRVQISAGPIDLREDRSLLSEWSGRSRVSPDFSFGPIQTDFGSTRDRPGPSLMGTIDLENSDCQSWYLVGIIYQMKMKAKVSDKKWLKHTDTSLIFSEVRTSITLFWKIWYQKFSHSRYQI